jgi:hypothetical protein
LKKIEVMTVVPAKYEAEGIDGVINVVLKKIEEAKYKVSLGGWGIQIIMQILTSQLILRKTGLVFLETSSKII